jgi:hypothetical protein
MKVSEPAGSDALAVANNTGMRTSMLLAFFRRLVRDAREIR